MINFVESRQKVIKFKFIVVIFKFFSFTSDLFTLIHYLYGKVDQSRKRERNNESGRILNEIN